MRNQDWPDEAKKMAWLPDGLHIFRPKIPIWRELEWKILVYIMTIWNSFQPFLIFSFLSVWYSFWSFGIFFQFGCLDQEKSGNSA
jgi:hypothetical protein